MKKLNTTNVAIILVVTFSGCKSLEDKYCSGGHKENISTTKVLQGNDSTMSFKSNNLKNDSLKSEFDSEEQLVCLLTGEEQAEQKERLQKEIFSQVKKVEELETGYIFYFKYEEAFLMKMTDYVIAENSCCPFFTFETRLHSKDDVSLKITGSSVKVKEMIKMVLVDME